MPTSSVNPGSTAVCLAALALSAAGCATHMRFVCPAQGGPEWRELTTAHVVLRTDLGPSQAESMARELELMRALLAQAVDLQEAVTPERIEVVALATREEMADFIGNRKYVGQALHDDTGRQRLLVAGLLTQDEQEIMIAHEMAHLVSLHAIPYQPRWFAEGLATYLSSVARTAGDGSRAVGATPQTWIADELRFERQATVRELMTWSGASEPARYAAAWLLIRTLATENAGALEAFERRLAAFEPASKAWNASFPQWSLDRDGGLEALDATLKARAHDVSGSGRRVSAQVDPAMKARTLSPAEVHGVRLDLPRRWTPEALQAEIQEALREDPGHVVALARAADEDGQGQALRRARRAVAAHPGDPLAWRLLARWLPDTAGAEREAALRRAVELAPDRAEHLVALADEIVSKDPAEAERLSARAVALAPWSASGLLVHAAALAYVGQCSGSSSDLQRAQDLQTARDGRELRAWYASRRVRLERRCTVPAAARADPLVERGFHAMEDDPALALSLADRALAADPDHTEAWLLRGNALLELGRVGEAEDAYRRQVKVYPANGWAWNGLGLSLAHQGRTAEAEAAYRKQLEVDPLHERARRNLVNLLLDDGQPHAAVSVLEPASKKAPRDANLIMDLGRSLMAAGEPRAGMEALEQALKLAPGPGSLNDAAYFLAKVNAELPRASAWAESSVNGHAEALRALSARAPGAREAAEASSLLAAWDTLGWVRFRQGRLEEAERYVSAALRVERSGEEFAHLGEILEEKGLHSEALAAFAQGVAADGNLDARRRLEALMQRAEVEKLAERARADLLRSRILQREPAAGSGKVDTRVLLVLAADGTVADVLPADGDGVPGAGALRGARHGVDIVDRSLGRLVVRGRYRCADGVCAWFLGSAPVPEGPLPE